MPASERPATDTSSALDGWGAMVAERVRCDLCGREMQHWFDICGDYRRPQAGEQFHLYWCRTDKFGKVFPRPTADEVKGFYDLESYYTHHKADSHKKGAVEQDAAHARWGFFPRLRQHLAWRLDYGGDLGVACLKEFVRS